MIANFYSPTFHTICPIPRYISPSIIHRNAIVFLNLPEARFAILHRNIRFPEDGGKAFDRIGQGTYQSRVDNWEEYGNRGSIEAMHLDPEESSDQSAGRSRQKKDL